MLEVNTKFKSKKVRNSLIGLGATALVVSPIIAIALCEVNKSESLNKQYDKSIYSGSFVSGADQYAHKDLIYYLNHRAELLDLIKDNYDSLAAEFTNSEIANEWVNSIANKDITDLDSILQSLETLKVSEGLRLFILQNLFEKVDIYKFSNFNKRSTNPEGRYAYSDEYLQTRDIYTSDFPGPNGEITPIPQHGDFVRRSGGQNEQTDLPILPDQYEFYRVTVADAPSWDIGEAKGDFDHISGMYYAQLLQTLPNRGWDNDDADSNWYAKRVTFEFRDIETQQIDSFNLLYNTARDTNSDNEDYTFVAIEPRDEHHITTDYLGNRVPSLFGYPISFNEMLQHFTYAHQDNAYIISGHEVDKGNDNEGGNALDGIPNAPVLNLLNANRSFYHVAYDLWNSALLKMNYNSERRNNPLDKNYLYVSSDDPSNTIALQNSDYIKNPLTGQRINRSGIDDEGQDYGVFSTDRTWKFWSNQTVLDFSIGYFISEFESFMNTLKTIPLPDSQSTPGLTGEDVAGGISSVWHQTITQASQELSRIGIELGFVGEAVMGSWLEGVVNIISIDWSSPMTAIDDIANIGLVKSPSWIAAGIKPLGSYLARNEIITEGIAAGMATFSEIAVPVVGWATAIGTAIFSFIPSRNGHSMLSNQNDHGLNDWDYQLRENTEVMARIARSFSENYTKGVMWYIEDSWVDFPELSIKTQGDESLTHLSPGSSMNYGEKIQFVAKPN